jgi:hypothetical protein
MKFCPVDLPVPWYKYQYQEIRRFSSKDPTLNWKEVSESSKQRSILADKHGLSLYCEESNVERPIKGRKLLYFWNNFIMLTSMDHVSRSKSWACTTKNICSASNNSVSRCRAHSWMQTLHVIV